MAADRHTRMVAFFKVALPLVALAMLSTLFLLSSRIRPGETIPFADGEVEERMKSQQVTGPFFSGVTGNGDRIAISAGEIVTGDDKAQEARDLAAQLDFNDGGSVTLLASRGKVEAGNAMATLSGNVRIVSTLGYRMTTAVVVTSLSGIDVTAPETVEATSPMGDLVAGQMRITSGEKDGGVHLLFSDGVKLVYDPKKAE